MAREHLALSIYKYSLSSVNLEQLYKLAKAANSRHKIYNIPVRFQPNPNPTNNPREQPLAILHELWKHETQETLTTLIEVLKTSGLQTNGLTSSSRSSPIQIYNALQETLESSGSASAIAKIRRTLAFVRRAMDSKEGKKLSKAFRDAIENTKGDRNQIGKVLEEYLAKFEQFLNDQEDRSSIDSALLAKIIR